MGAERSHSAGMMICAVTAMSRAVLHHWDATAVPRALALPVPTSTLGVLYIAFWIGRALITTPIEPPADD